MKITISLAQMDILLGRPEENLKKATEMIREAARRGSQVVLLPEIWASGYDLEHIAEHALATEKALPRLADLAEEHGLYIISSLITCREGIYFNTASIVSPKGEIVGEYDKAHLWRPLKEDKYFASGSSAPVFDLPWGKSALAICYDLRFPELFRRYALDGARVVFLPAEWPYPRLEHWQVLLRARAVENQFFVAACNRVGEAKGLKYFGHSGLYHPWKGAILEGDEEEGLLTAEIDLDEVDSVRAEFPILDDRRPDLY